MADVLSLTDPDALADLKKENEKLLSILNGTRDVVVRLNLQKGRFDYISPSVEALSGYAPDELIAIDVETAVTMVHPDDLPLLRATNERSLTEDAEAEYRQRTKNGEYIWVSNRMSVTKDVSGAPLYRTFTVSDITERKRVGEAQQRLAEELERQVAERTAALLHANQLLRREVEERTAAEETVRRNEEQFRVLIQNVKSAIALIDEAGRFTVVNRAFMEMFGLNAESDILNVNRQDWNRWEVYGEDLRLLHVDKHPVREAVLTGRPVRDRLVAVRNPGVKDLKWMLVNAEPLSSIDGGVHRVVCTYYEITERKRMEEELRQSERLYRAIGESTDYGVWVCEPDGRNIYASESFLKMVGMTQQECCDYGWGDVLHPDDAATTIAAWQECVRTEGAWDIVHRFQAADGQWRHVLARGIPVRDEQGKVACWAGINLDITPLKRMEEELKTSRDLLQRIIDNMPAIVYMFDLEERFLLCNAAVARLFQSTPDQLIGKSRSDIMPKETADWHEANDREVIKQGRALEFEEYGPYKDGHLITWLTSEFPLRDAQNEIYAVAGISTDITIRKRMEEELRQAHDELDQRVNERTQALRDANNLLSAEIERRTRAEQEFRTLAENAPDIILRFDRDLRYTYINPAFEKTYGFSKQDFLGRTDAEAAPAQVADLLTDTVHKVIETGKDLSIEWDMPTKQGMKHISSRISPELNREGQTESVLVISRDITEQGAIEERLRQSQKMEAIGTLAGGIAHDFNNMLAVILGNAELALDEVDEAPRQHLKNIVKASMRSRDLVKQILTFSRKNLEPTEIVKIVPLLQETCSLLRASLPSTIHIDLNIRTKEDTIVFAQPSQIQQIVMNLVSNAAHAMGAQQGTLTIGLTSVTLGADSLSDGAVPGRYIKLTVRDTGTGIAPEVHRRMFEPFFTTKELGRGTGMGLAVVYGIVKSHHGMIEVESEVGKGAKFIVLLPQSSTPLPTEEGEETLSLSLKQHVLFVDDEPAVSDMTKTMLERIGYRVTAFTDAFKALAAFTRQPESFDLVITDQAMPGITGIDLAGEVLAIRKNVPIILCTGYSEWVSAEQAKEIGIREFATKPLTTREMRQAIGRALGEAKET